MKSSFWQYRPVSEKTNLILNILNVVFWSVMLIVWLLGGPSPLAPFEEIHDAFHTPAAHI